MRLRLLQALMIAATIVAISGLAASAQDSQPKSRLNEIQKRGVLRVGMTGDYFPMTFRDPGVNEFKGHQVDPASIPAGSIATCPAMYSILLPVTSTTWV